MDRDERQVPSPSLLDSKDHQHDVDTLTTQDKSREDCAGELRKRFERLQQWQRRFLSAEQLDERLQLLVDFGLTDQDIAKAVPNAQPRSIRRWRTEKPPLTRLAERWEPVDDLCTIIRYLLSDGSYDEQGVVAWLRSRQPELSNERPLDVLRRGDFDAATAAAAQRLVSVRVDDHEQIAMPRRPSVTRVPVRHRTS
jgi:hypothetical protein